MSNTTLFFFIKVFVSGLLIASISQIAKFSPRWAAFLTALPLVSLLSILWIYLDKRDLNQLSLYCRDVVLWTLPSFFFFGAAIYLFKTKLSFPISFTLSLLAMALGVFLFQKIGLLK